MKQKFLTQHELLISLGEERIKFGYDDGKVIFVVDFIKCEICIYFDSCVTNVV